MQTKESHQSKTISVYIIPGLARTKTERKLLEIAEVVARVTGITVQELCGTTRFKTYVIPRQLFCFFSRQMTSCSLNEIGYFIKKDHATVIHSINKIKDCVNIKDASIMPHYQNINKKLY